MRKAVPFLILLLAGCGGDSNRETREVSQDLQTFDVSEEAPPAAPAIGPTAAPGVAFNYRYAFRLPGNRIAAVQEQHAQACERLGLARCRITGMRYRLVNESDIEGMLAFKLEPSIARQFGKAGIEAVQAAEGMLIDSEISGVDAGAAIAAANRSSAQISDDLRRIEEQLARPGLPAEERARLQSEAQQLRQSLRSNSAMREEQEKSLANTPVVFQYGSGDLVPGFDTRSPMRDALERAGENFIGGVATLFVIVVTLLPWVLLALFGWWMFRRLRPRLVRSKTPPLTE